MIPRFEDRIITTDLAVLDLANPISVAGYALSGAGTGGIFNPVLPVAVKLIGYGISTITLGDTVPGNWTLRFRINESGADTATASIPVTVTQTKQTHATVPWSTNPILQAGTSWNVLINGGNKNAFGSYLTLMWEII